MTINTIRFFNFRCFSNFELELRPGLNLLIGDNASGKTSVLRGLKYALSSFFSGFSDLNTQWNAPGNADYREVVENGVLRPLRPINIEFFLSGLNTPGLPEIDNRRQNILKSSGKNSKPLKSGIRQLKLFGRTLLENLYGNDGRRYPLPLFAAFSTEDIHTPRQKVSRKAFTDYTPMASAGYMNWFNGNGLLPFWLDRMLILKEAEKGEEELSIVSEAVQRALGADGCNIIQDISIRPNKKQVYFIFSDGREAALEQLSDGYRRLLNIVINIAFRCALLNRELFGAETCNLTRGVVLIDEIDLHLHPELQTKILHALHATFPSLQFIVSSHAPMVMSTLRNDEENAVYRLSYNVEAKTYLANKETTYGMGLSEIAEYVLDVPPRDSEIQNKLNELMGALDDDDISTAQALLTPLYEEFGDRLPELVRAQTLINIHRIENDQD